MANLNLPNGGWGWMIVAGSALTNVFNQSLISIFGLLYADHIEDLGGGMSGAAWIMNLCGVCINLSGLVTGPILKSYSPRFVTITGTLFTAFGLITSSFSIKMWHLMSYAIFVGFGLGLIQSATFIAVNSYFSTKRGQAVGFAMAGTGLGQMLMPNVTGYLLETYTFSGTALAIGALALHGVVGGLLFQPVAWHLRNESSKSFGEQLKLLEPKERKTAKPKRKDRVLLNITSSLELGLLKDRSFDILIIGLALAYTASINFSLLFPYYLQQTAKLNRSDTALCMTVLAAADLTSRLTFPSITDRLRISCRNAFLLGTMLLIIVRTGLAFTIDRTSLILISAIYGFIRAMTVVNQNLTISEYCRVQECEEKLAPALGLNMVTKGIFVITVGQVLGWLRDLTQSYSLCLHAQNACLAIVVVLWTSEDCRRRKRAQRLKIIDQ